MVWISLVGGLDEYWLPVNKDTFVIKEYKLVANVYTLEGNEYS